MKRSTTKDWYPADITVVLHKCGISLAKLSREAGLASSTLANTLRRPWPKGEWLITNVLEIHPSKTWPGRYLHTAEKCEPRKPLRFITITGRSGHNNPRCDWQDALISDT